MGAGRFEGQAGVTGSNMGPLRRSDEGEHAALGLRTGGPGTAHHRCLSTALCAGRLTGVLGGGLAADAELWHGVHFLLRDAHWRTPALCLTEPVHEVLGDGWRVSVTGHIDTTDPVALRISIEGHADGSLSVTGSARPSADIDINRLGLCLLHPLSAAGQALEVTHDDGRISRSSFPTLIPAWPPFTAIRALRHELKPGLWACAEFEGDSFELEDQRNNADASFKTYSRSNFMPRPYRLRAGEEVRQRVRLWVEESATANEHWARPATLPMIPARPPNPVRADPSTSSEQGPPAGESKRPRGSPMRVGIELTPADLARPEALAATTALLAELRPGHLHLVLQADPLRGTLEVDAAALAQALHAAQADLRLDLMDLTEADLNASASMSPSAAPTSGLQRLAAALAAAHIVPTDVALFPTTHAAIAAARGAFRHSRIGGGAADFFVQLNRQERLPALDFLSFTVCPIVHSADDATVLASHASLAGMLDTLNARYSGVPVQVGPSRIAARRSPLGDLAPSDGRRRVALAGIDTRDGSAFAADWAAGHVAALQAAGAQAVTVRRVSDHLPHTSPAP